MKYVIKLQDGKFIEKFFKTSVVSTSEINRAGQYSKSIAIKRIENLNIQAELIKIEN